MKNLIFERIISDLKQNEFFSDFKFRKDGSLIYLKEKDMKKEIRIQRWTDKFSNNRIIYPIYCVTYPILLKWFEKLTLKPLKDQRSRPSIAFDGSMLGCPYEFEFEFNRDGIGYEESFAILEKNIIKNLNSATL